MNLIGRIFKTTKPSELYTPNTIAKITYVKRGTIETDLEMYLLLPGKQIVIYGNSGTDKITLFRNKPREVSPNLIRTHYEKKLVLMIYYIGLLMNLTDSRL